MLDVLNLRQHCMKTYSENFEKLILLLPSLREMSGQFKLVTLGADNVDVKIVHCYKNKIELKLEHRLAMLDGSVIPDPVVSVAVHPLGQTAEVVTYEDCFGHRRVYCDKLMAFSPPAQRELNYLLGQWLSKLIAEKRHVE